MADEQTNSGGSASSAGTVKLQLNPPNSEKKGVAHEGTWIRAELNESGLTVRIFSQGSFAKRTVSHFVDLIEKDQPGLAPLADMLRQVLEAFGESVKEDLMEHAFAARAFARGQGEEV